MSTKLQNQFSLMLNNLNRNTYYAYKKMLENNIQKKTEKNYDINNYKYENSKNLTCKNSYSNFGMIKQKSYCPFGFTEKRFKWQNLKDQSNVIEPDDTKNKLRRIKIKNELEGGFKNFFNNTKNRNEHRNLNKSMENKTILQRRNSFFATRRVIQPEFDYDVNDFLHKSQKKININKNNNNDNNKILHSSSGSMKSLFEKTPNSFPVVKGKKKFKNLSFQSDCINIFSDEYNKYQIPRKINKFKYRYYKDNILISQSIEGKNNYGKSMIKFNENINYNNKNNYDKKNTLRKRMIEYL